MPKDTRLFIALGALLAAIAVAAGAIGAHALEGSVTPDRLATFKTAANYQSIHALALILVGILMGNQPSRLAKLSGWLFLLGILVFSGSLYILVLFELTIMGAITPIGGAAFISAWLMLALGVWRER